MTSISDNSKLFVSFSSLLNKCRITRLLNSCGFTKRSGCDVLSMLIALLESKFFNKNLYLFLQSQRGQAADFSKSSCYRFLDLGRFNWQKLELKIATKVIAFIASLRSKDCIHCLIADDSMIERPRAKKTELLSRQFNHVSHKHVKGFTNLALAWTDGISTIPVLNYFISSSKKELRIMEADKHTDGRFASSECRKIAVMHKPEVLLLMCRRALNAGIKASYLLVDSWFFSDKMAAEVGKLGLGLISLVKRKLQFQPSWENHRVTQNKIVSHLLKSGSFSKHDEYLYCLARTKANKLVKLVFTLSRSNRHEWLTIVSTDPELSAEEIIRQYSKRWGIEVLFRVQKEHLGLSKECQGHKFNVINAFMIISNLRYLLLEFNRRMNDDPRSLGQMFYLIHEELRERPFREALESLLSIIDGLADDLNAAGLLKDGCLEQARAVISSRILQWYSGLTRYVADIMRSYRSLA